jgi:hypothetical protein
VVELVDALASGASGLTAVKVRVLSWAPSFLKFEIFQAVIAAASAAPAMPGGNGATLPRAMFRQGHANEASAVLSLEQPPLWPESLERFID